MGAAWKVGQGGVVIKFILVVKSYLNYDRKIKYISIYSDFCWLLQFNGSYNWKDINVKEIN